MPRLRRVPAQVPLFVCVFLFTFADSLQQTILPLGLKDAGLSVTAIGLLIAIPQGIGFLTSLPGAAHGDRAGPRMITMVSALIAAGALALLAYAASDGGLAWWILPIIAYGLTRFVVWISVLGAVSTTGDPFRMQGLNGATQRAAAAAAAIVATAIILDSGWSTGFALMAVSMLGIGFMARSALQRGDGVAPHLPHPSRAYGAAIRMASRKLSIVASSLIALCCLTVMLIGNSFFALSLEAPATETAVSVGVLLLTRDLSSILFGLCFAWLVRRVRIPGTVLIAGACAATGLGILAVAPGTIPAIVLGAILQGAAISWCIGTTNLLAVGQETGGAGLRIAASSIIPCIGSLILPVAFAAVLQAGGSVNLFLIASATAVGLGVAAFFCARAAIPRSQNVLQEAGPER